MPTLGTEVCNWTSFGDLGVPRRLDFKNQTGGPKYPNMDPKYDLASTYLGAWTLRVGTYEKPQRSRARALHQQFVVQHELVPPTVLGSSPQGVGEWAPGLRESQGVPDFGGRAGVNIVAPFSAQQSPTLPTTGSKIRPGLGTTIVIQPEFAGKWVSPTLNLRQTTHLPSISFKL